MKPTIIKKLGILAVGILITSLASANFQQGNAIEYHDGSLDEYMTKVKVEPMKGKRDLWSYIVKVCPDDENIRVAEVILKSDIEEIRLGVNKVVGQGKCGYYGAVMKAKDGSTLGAELIEDHEAREKISQLESEIPNLSGRQSTAAAKEILHYLFVLNLL